MALLDLEGACVRANGALRDLLGYTEEELRSRSFRDVSHPDEVGLSIRQAVRLLRGEIEEYSNERRMLHASGGIVHVIERVGLARDRFGAPLHFLVALEDVSELRQMEYRLQELAERDGLTGLPNRPLFEQELAGHVARTRMRGEEAALLLLDLDHFKLVNDAHGHRVGDELLRRVAGQLRAALPRGALVARLGGDELAVLVGGCDAERAPVVADQLLEAIRAVRVPVDDEVLHTAASVGVVVMDGGAAEPEELLVSADLAMYEAKAAGGDRAVVHDPSGGARERASTDMRMSRQLRVALERDDLVLHAQPIVDAATGEPLLYELLVRLPSDGGEMLLPGAFLPHAERFGYVSAVDRWVAARAIEHVREHGVSLSINLSGRSIGDPSLPGFLEAAVDAAGIDPRKLVFEVTETTAIANMGHAQRLARRLRGLGCRFALDDFGAGFASFTYVKQLPFDFLKIDGSFVRDLATSREDRLLVGALVGIARGLGKATVAEYVVDGEVLEEVRGCGVDLAQGFHIGAPAPLEHWLGG
jgi:diguanylate cyclase (GGDEF)-like protein/PAS domain S-box-containing protein